MKPGKAMCYHSHFQWSLQGAVSVRVCTWNLHGCAVDPEDDIRPWLFSGGKQADIYIVGIQDSSVAMPHAPSCWSQIPLC